jgi:hypothetical protein
MLSGKYVVETAHERSRIVRRPVTHRVIVQTRLTVFFVWATGRSDSGGACHGSEEHHAYVRLTTRSASRNWRNAQACVGGKPTHVPSLYLIQVQRPRLSNLSA